MPAARQILQPEITEGEDTQTAKNLAAVVAAGGPGPAAPLRGATVIEAPTFDASGEALAASSDAASYTVPSTWATFCLAIGGVLLPAAAITVEAVTRICAKAFSDPMPTMGHAILITFVPVANAILLVAAHNRVPAPGPRLLVVAGALACVISAVWSVMFIALLPKTILAIVYAPYLFPLAVLPWAPTATLVASGWLTIWMAGEIEGGLIGGPATPATQGRDA